jgi:hypothetical protein
VTPLSAAAGIALTLASCNAASTAIATDSIRQNVDPVTARVNFMVIWRFAAFSCTVRSHGEHVWV